MEPAPRPWASVILSVFERVVARASTAVVTLLLALFTGPELVGYYAAVILAMTLYQSLADGVLRQIGVESWNFENGPRFVKVSSIASACFGLLLIGFAAITVSGQNTSPGLIYKLAPLALVPLVNAAYVGVLTKAQRSPAGWKRIAKAQGFAAFGSLVVAVPLLPLFDIGAASLQVLIAEIIFWMLIRRWSAPNPEHRGRAPLWSRYYVPTAVSSLLGWSQSQLERLILVLLSTPGQVGAYSFAVAIARSAGDALTSGVVNAVRSQISTESSEVVRANHFRRGVITGVRAAIVVQVVVTVACVLVLPRFFDSSWQTAFSAVPVFAISGVFAAVNWVVSAYIISMGESRRLLVAQIVGITLSVTCGLALSLSLLFGAAICVVRDLVGVCFRLYIVRRTLDIRFLSYVVACSALSVLIGLMPLIYDQVT